MYRGARGVSARQARFIKSWTNTPMKCHTDEKPPRYTSGAKAGELYMTPADQAPSAYDTLMDRIKGKTPLMKKRALEEEYLQATVIESQLMRAELLGEDRGELFRRQLGFWSVPFFCVFAGLMTYALEPWVNPQVDQRMRIEETRKFLEVSDSMETFKVESTLEKITEIENELKRRGVKVPQ
eukprot:TRINITY_DN4170_c0_g1_i1.p1 TRINITY_DN4170_c0_g1~~TRINITY_DN4170_c0_g1_i1.p1  ORF type:complete len:182 (+),score=69.14 TRINITY_DN4170_c0_g1_i1:105-650(+)